VPVRAKPEHGQTKPANGRQFGLVARGRGFRIGIGGRNVVNGVVQSGRPEKFRLQPVGQAGLVVSGLSQVLIEEEKLHQGDIHLAGRNAAQDLAIHAERGRSGWQADRRGRIGFERLGEDIGGFGGDFGFRLDDGHTQFRFGVRRSDAVPHWKSPGVFRLTADADLRHSNGDEHACSAGRAHEYDHCCS
jgi:hypothetical protein